MGVIIKLVVSMVIASIFFHMILQRFPILSQLTKVEEPKRVKETVIDSHIIESKSTERS